jgi:hypothetical protein
MGLLSAAELSALISGTGTGALKLADFVDQIELSNGDGRGSQPVQLLFELLLEWDEPMRALFFKFVTGAERLPIGGLAAVRR